jgi:SH3-like domain-containing protein
VEIPPIVEVLQWQKVNDTDQGLAWVVDMIAKAATQIAA